MSIKDKFLNEMRIHTFVELIIGSKEIKGTIVSLDSETVQIKKTDGKQATIALDSITYYEVSDAKSGIESTPTHLKKEINPTKKSNLKKHQTTNSKSSNKQPITPEAMSPSSKKPATKYSIFMAAKKAREQEKNLSKAESLYLEALQKNERPSAAAADLVSLMIQKHEISKAAEYLEQYGSRYMREEAYKNVRAQLIKMDPKLANQMSPSETKESATDYFLLAQKAAFEKDLQKSITYYKEAIKRKQRLSGSVPNLVSIYARLEMYPEAIELLDHAGQEYMERSSYLNLRLSVLSKAKDPNYKQDIVTTHTQLLSLAHSEEKKMDLLFAHAYLMNQIGEYGDAIQLFHLYLQKIQRSVYSDPEKAHRKKIFALMNLCTAYYQSRNYSHANKYAAILLKIEPENELAQSIISGEASENFKLADDTIGVTKISNYILQKIDQLNLQNELKNKTDIKEDIFIGKAEYAKKIIHSILSTQVKTSINDETQSNNYFTIAKLIRQILDRDEKILPSAMFTERRYQLYVAIGSFFYGNYRLYRTELTNHFDTARYCFLETISIFQDAKQTHKCWAVATVRYIQTYFYSRTEVKEKGGKLYYAFHNDNDHEYQAEIDKVFERTILTSIEEFVIGMIEMLTYNTKAKDFVLSHIQRHVLFGKILDVLGKINGQSISNTMTDQTLKELWNKSAKIYYAWREEFLCLILETINSVFIVGQLQNNFNKLIAHKFMPYLNSTDAEYFHDLKQIFISLLRYNEISEFDYKAETLSKADNIRKRLEEKINDYPTYISIEKLLPMLTQLQAKIFKESAELYGDSEPVITVKLSGDCSIDEDELIVRTPIAFTNKNNVQNADNISITIIGEHVQVLHDEQLSRGLLVGNGKAQEEIVAFKVTPQILKDQVFSVHIKIQYQYKKNMTELQDHCADLSISIPLYSNTAFQTIENKFEPYRNGSAVKEASMFYGRDKDIESIIQQISDDSGKVLKGRCLALYGQTRTGKSSLLYHLERKLREINSEGNIIINVGSIGEENLSGNDITEFLYTLLDGLQYEVNSKHPLLKELFDKEGIQIDPGKLLEHPEHAQLYFNDLFKKINRCFECLENHNYNIIIMIDEFTYIYDWICRGIMTDRIMKFWKAFIQNNGVFAIIIGQDHMMKFVGEKQFTNDFGSTDLRKVTYLCEEDAKRLMYEPILLTDENGEKINRYREGALDRLYELTAGSAFLIMNLCSGLVDYLNQIHSVYITRAHVDDYLRKNLNTFEEARFFEPQYDDKSNVNSEEGNRENKRILHRIARLSNKKEWTPLNLIVLNEEDKQRLTALEERDVIIISNNERCKIKVALYKEWIIEKYGLEGNNG